MGYSGPEGGSHLGWDDSTSPPVAICQLSRDDQGPLSTLLQDQICVHQHIFNTSLPWHGGHGIGTGRIVPSPWLGCSVALNMYRRVLHIFAAKPPVH